jgi:hypothetical protein
MRVGGKQRGGRLFFSFSFGCGDGDEEGSWLGATRIRTCSIRVVSEMGGGPAPSAMEQGRT